MATVGFYNDDMKMIGASSVSSEHVDHYYDRIETQAQELADECGCNVSAWERDEDGNPRCGTGIEVQPQQPKL